MSKLTAAKRNALPKSVFGEPGRRAYPMPDKSHAANAKARASQAVNAGRMSEAEKAKIDRKADRVMGKDGYSKKEKSEHSKGMEHYGHGGYGPKGHSGGKASHRDGHGSAHAGSENVRVGGMPVSHHDLGSHMGFEHHKGGKIERKSAGQHDFHRGGHMGHDLGHDGRMQEHHRFVDGKAASHIGERDGSLRMPLKIHKAGVGD